MRFAVRTSLGSAECGIRAIAARLNIHERTLQRRLRDGRTSFEAILDDERRRAAHHYLTGTDFSLTRITALLGLSQPSVLTRCCHRWWNATPTAVRRRAVRAGSRRIP